MSDLTSPSLVQATMGASDVGNDYSGSNAPSSAESYKAQAEAQNLMQKTTNDAVNGAFKWVERIVTPSMFASPESTLVAIGPPVASLASGAGDFNLVGMCSNFSYSVGNNVFTFKELRAERTIVVPMKALPGQLNMSRLMGAFPNFGGLINEKDQWVANNQARVYKKLFGLILIFLNMQRTNKLGTLYFERCAIANNSVSVVPGQNNILETISVVFDRVQDNFTAASVGTKTAKSTTTTTTTTDTLPSSLPPIDTTSTTTTGGPIANGSIENWNAASVLTATIAGAGSRTILA